MKRREALKVLGSIGAAALARCAVAAEIPASPVAIAAPATIKPLRTIEVEVDPVDREAGVPSCTGISPNGQVVAAGCDDHRVRLWNVADGTQIAQLREHTDWVRAVAFHPGGKKLLTAGDDHTVIIWDLTTNEVLHRIEVAGCVLHCAAFRPDGKLAAVSGFDDIVRLYDVETGASVKELTASASDVKTLHFSPNNAQLAAAGRDGVIRLWDLHEFKLLRDIPAHRMRVRALAFTPDSSQLASAGDDRKFFLWNVDGTRAAALASPPGRIFALAFLGPDYLASGGSDNVVRVLDVRSRRELSHLVGHKGSVAALDYFADGGLLASAGFDTTVRLWKPLAGAAETPSQRTAARRP